MLLNLSKGFLKNYIPNITLKLCLKLIQFIRSLGVEYGIYLNLV